MSGNATSGVEDAVRANQELTVATNLQVLEQQQIRAVIFRLASPIS
jgi:hypothetical protein